MGKEGIPNYFTELKEKDNQLLANIKAKLSALETLLEEVSSHWGYEDSIYRFYHHSFKVYGLQNRLGDGLWDGRTMGRSSVYKFISSRRKPTGISFEKQVAYSSKGLADSGVLYVLENA